MFRCVEGKMLRLTALSVLAFSLALMPAAMGQNSAGWEPYTDSIFKFSAELPLGAFEVIAAEGTPGIALEEIGGRATVNLYGGPAEGMTREALEARLERGEQIRTITYRAGGKSWLVLSGFYNGADIETIFYTKVLFSPDQRTFSAFEITFPAEDKPRFEDMVERFEDNFTRPQL
jgi:hypothetical protein